MIRKIIPKLVFLLLPFIIISCNGIGPKKVKNIVELTPKLSVETKEIIQLNSTIKNHVFSPDIFKNKKYSVTKYPMIAQPICAKGIFYTLDNRGVVTAFSIKDKVVRWTYNVNTNKSDSFNGGGILHHQGNLYITNGSRFLVILNAETGYETIRKELPDIIRIKPVILNDNIILVQTISNQTFALDSSHLNLVWQHEGMLGTLTSSYHVSPIVHGDKVIVNYSSGQIFGLNAITGAPLWTIDLSNNQEIGLPNFESTTVLCTPVIDNNSVYIANGAGKLMKIDINSGHIIWQAKANDVQSMSLAGNSLFIINNAQQVAAFNTISGKVNFAKDLKDIELKKVKATSFLPPIVSKTINGWELSIITNSGELYNINFDTVNIVTETTVIKSKIIKNIQYYGLTCCGLLYFVTDKEVIFAQ